MLKKIFGNSNATAKKETEAGCKRAGGNVGGNGLAQITDCSGHLVNEFDL